MMPYLLKVYNRPLWDKIQPFAAKESDMPWVYRYPDGRWKHDDWAIGKNIRRIDCAYKMTLPYTISGDVQVEKRWILWDPSYPTVPNVPTELRDYHTAWGDFKLPHILADYAGYGKANHAVWIDGEWVPNVFTKFTKKYGTRRLSWYYGLHQDLHVSPPNEEGITRSDLMCYDEPPSMSFIKES